MGMQIQMINIWMLSRAPFSKKIKGSEELPHGVS